MLTRHELARLERSLRATKVLSVYLSGEVIDPAERDAWRRRLVQLVTRAREALTTAPHEEREAFERCVAELGESLVHHPDALDSAGWAGFFTGAGESHAMALPVEMPDLVAWGDGVRIAPYVRALKHLRPAVVAVVDARRATLYVYAAGALEEVERLDAPLHPSKTRHMGTPPSPGFHGGTRGGVGSDEADRERERTTAALTKMVVRQLVVLAGAHSWVLVGGIPESVDALLAALPAGLRGRAQPLSGVDIHASQAVIRKAAERGARAASRARELAQVLELLEREAAGARGVTHREATGEALREHAADFVLFTGTFVREHPLDAEAIVRLAFEQQAELEYVSGHAAQHLDAAGGVGALLRFSTARQQAPIAQAALQRG